MRRIQPLLSPSDVGDFADEVQDLFLELGRTLGAQALAGECSPTIDVFETDQAVEITVDLPGVDAAALRVLIKGDAVLIVGEKGTRRGRVESTYHLVERGFGRFARTVRLGRACDGAHAGATLSDGELRISIPKIVERRGRRIQIAIRSSPYPA